MGKISTEDCNEERSIGLSERFRESFIIIPFLRTKIFQLITWFTYVTGFRIHQGRFREDLLKLCDMTLTCRKATPHLFLFKETFIDMNSSKMANEVLDTFYCSCGQDFEHRQILEVHKKICPTIKEVKIKDTEKQRQRRIYNSFNCAFCFKEFNCSEHLRTHIRQSQHHKDTDMKCETCDQIFSDYYNFAKHRRTAHKKFKCNKCSKQFICQDYLVFHYNVGCTDREKKVPKSPRYACNECEKKFKSKGALQMHIKSHQAWRYKCEKCGQKFKSQPALDNHDERIHTEIKIIETVKPVKPKLYKCTQCAYSTDIKELFQRHFLRNKH